MFTAISSRAIGRVSLPSIKLITKRPNTGLVAQPDTNGASSDLTRDK